MAIVKPGAQKKRGLTFFKKAERDGVGKDNQRFFPGLRFKTPGQAAQGRRVYGRVRGVVAG